MVLTTTRLDPHPSVASLLPPSPGGRGKESDSLISLSHREWEGARPAQPGGKGEGRLEVISSPQEIADLPGVDHLLIEGGARTAAAFLQADLVDRLLLYRAPILIGGGLPALSDIGLASLADAHGRWRLLDARALGRDRLEVYERP